MLLLGVDLCKMYFPEDEIESEMEFYEDAMDSQDWQLLLSKKEDKLREFAIIITTVHVCIVVTQLNL